MAKWLYLKQDYNDTVTYVSDDNLNNPVYVDTDEFLDQIKHVRIQDSNEFERHFECMKFLFLNLEDGSWELKKFDLTEEITQERLMELNSDSVKVREKMSPVDSIFQDGKRFIGDFISNKRRNPWR